LIFVCRFRHVRYRAIVAVIVLVTGVAACALAQSSRPSEPKQDEAAAKREEETNNQLRAISSALTAIRNKQAETEQREANNQAANSDPLGPSTWSNWVLAILAAIAAFLAAMNLGAIREQVTANVLEARAAHASAEWIRTAERAYVGIGNKGGFHPRDRKQGDPANKTPYRIEIRLFNSGHTPARVHGGLLQLVFDTMHGFKPQSIASAKMISGDVGHIPGTFLHPESPQTQKLDFFLTPEQVLRVSNGKLYLAGYVEYSTFQRRFRAVHCRWVNPEVTDVTKGNMRIDSATEKGNRKPPETEATPTPKKWWRKLLRLSWS
jgi:hypothetical protein